MFSRLPDFSFFSRRYRTHLIVSSVVLASAVYIWWAGMISGAFASITSNVHAMSIIGVFFILATAIACSTNRAAINYKLVVSGVLLQILLACFVLQTAIGHSIISGIARGFTALYSFAGAGISFVFGGLGSVQGPLGMVFAFQVLPIIIFFGALTSLLYHLGIIQWCVRGMAIVIRPLLGTSGAETLCAVANSMLGQTEAPLLIKQYLPDMTVSEMLVVMVSGMATLSGSLLAIYGSLGVPMEHLLAASVMAIPGSLVIAKILMPETESPKTASSKQLDMKPQTSNILDAISTGTSDGLSLALNVGAMLVTFISLIALINYLLHDMCGLWSLNQFFAFIGAPIARLIGIAPADAAAAGDLLGTKLVVNEFVAYFQLPKTGMSLRSAAIMTYALCGFSNFSCIGIQIGGIGALAPSKRTQLTQLGMRALLGGTLTNLLNAAIASLFIV